MIYLCIRWNNKIGRGGGGVHVNKLLGDNNVFSVSSCTADTHVIVWRFSLNKINIWNKSAVYLFTCCGKKTST